MMKTLTIAGASAVLALHSLAAYAGDGEETTVEGRELHTPGRSPLCVPIRRQWIMWGWDREDHTRATWTIQLGSPGCAPMSTS